ncbi:MAG: hypothetical protein M1839_006442 [Geoglossum umbratile]|nr:MAG: hypothetical protein M1839_006442 [Geoglossum umbratile]
MPVRATRRLEADIVTAFQDQVQVLAPKGPNKRLLCTSPDTHHDTFTDPDSDSPSDIGPDSDPEGEYLRKRIDYQGSAGRAKPRRSDWTNGLVKREVEHWQEFCRKIEADPDNTLLECETKTFKTYLEWHVRTFRIKKESTIQSYWKRVSLGYIDLAGHRMDNGAELDIRDWIPGYLTPTYRLDNSEKEKRAMYVQDLYAILHAHWVDDTKALHGRLRAELPLLLLLSGATTTRPGALVESSSAKGSNKALSYEHITVMKVRDVTDPKRSTIVVKVALVHIKNSGGKGRRKKFIFRFESLPAFCIVSHFLALALNDGAFKRDFNSIEEVFSLEVPANRDVLRLKWKKDKEKQPIFWDVEKTPDGIRVSDSKALPYIKYRDHFVHLGRLAGFEYLLELYQLRRASGRNINSALTPEERNQVMGHRHGSTYERYYMPDLVERDFQSIYFGTPSQDLLIQSVARMGLSRDRRAPTELSEHQKLEVKSNPELVKLCEKRERCKNRIYRRGYSSIEETKGTELYDRYKGIEREVNGISNKLRRKRLDQAVQDFHDSIDTIEVNKQLDGVTTADILIQPTIQYELRERATIAKLLSLSFDECDEERALKIRAKFIYNLARLCQRQESRWSAASHHQKLQLSRFNGGEDEKLKGAPRRKRKLSETGNDNARKSPRLLKAAFDGVAENVQQLQDKTRTILPVQDDNVRITQNLYPMVFTYPVCLICIGNEQLSYAERMRPFKRKYTLQKHLNAHIQ